ncbi:STM4014 family protein [Streptomyces sp. DSM 42041]|uniref:STM4014 family protein n=1 Tax=Streptomyces hazeniae TaxID=3075538 RepID=A0ABU2NUG9_9ACTN|nr:STM4014 family protein [Streptomyces sp. DSM 42041]MDT0380636.1 STM4014 family protein [Streptomyces sp. DSM 42041]
MSPSPSSGRATRFAVVGNPANRRVTLFADAVRAAGLPAPRVLPWADVLRAGASFRAGETVRIDSPGENAEADRLLRGTADGARVEGTARWYRAFTAAVDGIGRAAREAGARLLDDPGELAVLFDKRLCHGVTAAAGVTVPASPTSGPRAPRPSCWEEVRGLLDGAGLRRAFLKPAHGSSASGVVAWARGPGGRMQAVTSAEQDGDGRLFNSLRVRTLRTEREIARLVDVLAPDGLHLEQWLPKAAQHGRAADLRVVVVGGRATHAVVRTSRHPMTNLHLGGRRGDLARARTAVEAAGGRWRDALDACERAAACFPRTLCVGVDLLPRTGWRRFAVGEVNAFGDLLPGLTGFPGGGAEGQDAYAAQVDAVRREEAADAAA